MSDSLLPTVVNLGAGIQSTALTHLVVERDPRIVDWCASEGLALPKYPVFADTGDEPQAVYDHLERFTAWAAERDFEIVVVQFDDMCERIRRRARGEKGFQCPPIPWFVRQDPDQAKERIAERDGLDIDKIIMGGSDLDGQNNRGCTATYKIDVIERYILERGCGVTKGQRRPKEIKVCQWLGISCDEASRMKPSQTKWSDIRWPLVEAMAWNRGECRQYLAREWPHPVARSACKVCPYHNDGEWHRMKTQRPDDFEDACKFDEDTRSMPGYRGKLYLHASRQPLRDVMFDASEAGQLDLFQNECSGGCGL